jgi:hypothetical protein
LPQHRERTQLVGDALLEGAVLIAVLRPLERYVTETDHQVGIWEIILAETLAGILLWWGYHHGRQRLSMDIYGVWLATFGFFAVVFLVGKYWQSRDRSEREKRRATR